MKFFCNSFSIKQSDDENRKKNENLFVVREMVMTFYFENRFSFLFEKERQQKMCMACLSRSHQEEVSPKWTHVENNQENEIIFLLEN